MNPKSTDCEADALITTPSRRSISIQSDCYAPPLVPSTSYSIAHALFVPPLQNLMLFPKHHHYPFSKTCPHHRSPLTMASPSKVLFKLSKLVSFWLLLFSIILSPHIALIIAFSVLLKIAISFFLRHHVSLPYSIANLTQL